MTVSWFVRVVALAALFTGVAPSAAAAQKKSRDVILRDEILKSSQRDADLFNAIKVLRPHMLEAPRGMRSMGGTVTSILAVYVDKIRQPGPDVLQQLMARDVAEVRYLDPNRSQNEYGITANGGAIVIKKFIGGAADSLGPRKPPQ